MAISRLISKRARTRQSNDGGAKLGPSASRVMPAEPSPSFFVQRMQETEAQYPASMRLRRFQSAWLNMGYLSYMPGRSRKCRSLYELSQGTQRALCDFFGYEWNFSRNSFWTLRQELRKEEGDIRMLDDGAGDGRILADLQYNFNDVGFSTYGVALDRSPTRTLTRRLERGQVNEIVAQRTETYEPDANSFDLVLDIWGATHYLHPRLRMDHWLRNAHALVPGGIMISSFGVADANLRPWNQVRMGGYTRDLVLSDYLPSDSSLRKQLRWVSDHFAMFGFQSQTYVSYNARGFGDHEITLIAQNGEHPQKARDREALKNWILKPS